VPLLLLYELDEAVNFAFHERHSRKVTEEVLARETLVESLFWNEALNIAGELKNTQCNTINETIQLGLNHGLEGPA